MLAYQEELCPMEGADGIFGQWNFFPFAKRHSIVDISHYRKFNHSVQNLGFGMSEFWLFVLSCIPVLTLSCNTTAIMSSPVLLPDEPLLEPPTCAEYWPGYPALPASQEFAMGIEIHSPTDALLTRRRYVKPLLQSGASKCLKYLYTWCTYGLYLWPFGTKRRSQLF